jgi:signal transduction histidine kinase
LQLYQHLLQTAKAKGLLPELVAQVEAALQKAQLDYLAKEAPQAIEQSLEGVERVTRIVRAMKDFSHPGTGQKVPTDLKQTITSTLTVSRNEWKYVAELVTDFDPHLPLVPCLPSEFSQVILNLVVNAAHAIADVVGNGGHGLGTIKVTTRCCGEHAEICVSDTGAGIPESARLRIFDPFFTTKPIGKGSGQGLAIARSVVEDKHQGSITFETEIGKGTTFTIRLPLHVKAQKLA